MEDNSINEKKIDETVARCKKMLDVSYYKYGEARKNYGDGRLDALGSLYSSCKSGWRFFQRN